MRPHLAALQRGIRAGFRFLHLPTWDDLLAIQGMRVRGESMEVFLSRSATDAVAARVLIEDMDFHSSTPVLWEARGTVADVFTELLDLPPHGAPNAPTLAKSRACDFWLPGQPLVGF